VEGFFLASFQALSVLRFCGLGKMLPMAKRNWPSAIGRKMWAMVGK
jgi:hypothetical protein